MFNFKEKLERMVSDKVQDKYPYVTTHLFVKEISDFAVLQKWLLRFPQNEHYRYTLTCDRVTINIKVKFIEHVIVVSTADTIQASLATDKCKVLVDKLFTTKTYVGQEKIVFI